VVVVGAVRGPSGPVRRRCLADGGRGELAAIGVVA